VEIAGPTLVANRMLAGSACGKRRIVRPLNSIVRPHEEHRGRLKVNTSLCSPKEN